MRPMRCRFIAFFTLTLYFTGSAPAKETLSCSLVIPLRYALRLAGWSPLKMRLTLCGCERANQHF